MGYLLLIMENRGDRAACGPEEGRRRMAAMEQFGADLTARGVLRGSNALRSDAQAVRVQAREGKRVLRDGPFAEAREMVGGYFLLDVATREQALAIATQCPAAAWAVVEVREIGACFDE